MSTLFSEKGIIQIDDCLFNIINMKEDSKVAFIYNLESYLFKNDEDFFDKFINFLPISNLNIIHNIKFGKKLREGTYGLIFNVIYEGKNAIAKIPKKNLEEFILESLVHLLLYCFRDFIFPLKDYYFPIPSLYSIIRVNNIMSIMEKIDYTYYDIFSNKPFTIQDEINLIKIMILLCINLEVLQKHVGFIHRDMHIGNIMFKKEEMKVNIDEFSFETEYLPYFIDFGITCLDFGKCGLCNMDNGFININNFYPYKSYCIDFSHDMRLFMASIWYSNEKEPGYVFGYNSILKPLFQKYFLSVKDLRTNCGGQEKYEKRFDNRILWHCYYDSYSDYLPDKNFLPQNLKKVLLELLQLI